MNGFEGSFLGNAERINPQTRLECGVCWWVYDPAEGDPLWQIPAGTAFSDLPDHWRCPSCDAAQHQFMALKTLRLDEASENPQAEVGFEESGARRKQIADAYARVAERMRGLPVYRDDLPVGVLGPRKTEAGMVGVLYTPWCMNLFLLAADSERLREGSERYVPLPSGDYPFLRGYLEGVGAIESCSLFSPMDAFDDGEAVEAVARETIKAVLATSESEIERSERRRDESELADPSRRRFLGVMSA